SQGISRRDNERTHDPYGDQRPLRRHRADHDPRRRRERASRRRGPHRQALPLRTLREQAVLRRDPPPSRLRLSTRLPSRGTGAPLSRSRDLAIAALIGLVVAATRLPFATSALWSWDSVLYARALELGYRQGIDVAEQRPQAPGYVFYVALASLVRQLTHDSNSALVAVSIVASGLAAATAYLVARRFARSGAACAGALGLGLSPIAWTFGETAVPYELLALGSISIAGAFHASRGRPDRTIAASLLWGLAAGFRQDLLVILGPLWLWTIAPVAWRDRAIAAGSVAAGCLFWLVPSALGSGWLDGYVAALTARAGRVETMSPIASGAPQLVSNLSLSAYGLFWGSLAIGLVMLVRGLARLAAVGRSPNATFFALWIVPALVFYPFVHTGDPAYVLSVLPAIFVAFAAWLDALGAGRPWAIALGPAGAVPPRACS